MAKSGAKGKRGEREFCQKLREHGFGAIRSGQVAGVKNFDESADIITSLDDVLRFEIKRGYEDTYFTSKQFERWVNKAIKETPDHKTPVLAWRKNRQPWVIYTIQRHVPGFLVSKSVKNFVFVLSGEYNLQRFYVDDPETWKTTGTFGPRKQD